MQKNHLQLTWRGKEKEKICCDKRKNWSSVAAKRKNYFCHHSGEGRERERDRGEIKEQEKTEGDREEDRCKSGGSTVLEESVGVRATAVALGSKANTGDTSAPAPSMVSVVCKLAHICASRPLYQTVVCKVE